MSDVALRFGAKDDGLDAKFRKVDQQLEKFKSGASSIAGSIGGVFKAISAIGAVVAIGKLTSEALEFADQLKKVQAQTGLSTDAIQRLQFMAGQSSVDVAKLTDGVSRLQRTLGGFEEGSKQAGEALRRLGLANAQFQNQDPEQQFIAVAQAVSGLATQNEKVLAVTKLFGESGANLLPVLDAIGKDSAELEARFDAIGGPVGKNAIDAVDNLGDEFATAGLAAKSFVTEILALIAPPVIAGLQQVEKIIGGLRILAGGGSNESVNITKQIETLEATRQGQIALAARGGQRAIDAVNARIDKQIEDLKRKQNELHNLGVEGIIPRNPFPVAEPDAVAIEETDEERAQREKDEAAARLQRIQQIATMHQIEEDMAFKSSERLAQIDQAALDAEIERLTIATGEKLRIRTNLEVISATVREQFGLQEIKLEEIKNQSILDLSLGLFNQLAAANTKFAKLQQHLATVQIVWSTAAGIMRAFETLPWPANLAAAAKVAITGIAQYQRVKSTNYNGGSISAAAPNFGGSAAGSFTPQPVQQNQDTSQVQGATTVYINGLITKDVIDQLLRGLREGFDRNVILIPQNSLQAQLIREGAYRGSRLSSS